MVMLLHLFGSLSLWNGNCISRYWLANFSCNYCPRRSLSLWNGNCISRYWIANFRCNYCPRITHFPQCSDPLKACNYSTICFVFAYLNSHWFPVFQSHVKIAKLYCSCLYSKNWLHFLFGQLEERPFRSVGQ